MNALVILSVFTLVIILYFAQKLFTNKDVDDKGANDVWRIHPGEW